MSKMSLGIAVAAMLLLPSTGQPLDVKGNTITLTPEEAASCVAGGGCVVVPRETVMLFIASEIEKAQKACLKGST